MTTMTKRVGKIERKKKAKVGLDYHGVIDTQPELFSLISNLLVDAGHEVHIITGTRITEKFKEHLIELGITYTHIFSISDYHHDILHTPMKGYDEGDPWIDEILWNQTKAWYCQSVDIDWHLDDSAVYGDHFKTIRTAFLLIKPLPKQNKDQG